MKIAIATIGQTIRGLSTGFRRLPLNWNLIDAFTKLEEREAERPQQLQEQIEQALLSLRRGRRL